MSLSREQLRKALAAHGPLVRVVVAEVQGSAPREVGAAMLVWPGGQAGSIGGGALEHEAAGTARAMLAAGAARRFERMILGPDRGQCCGGAVALVFERWDAAGLEAHGGPLLARPVAPDAPAEPPLAVRRAQAQARSGQAPAQTFLAEGWLVEPVDPPAAPVWIWGAGHVGRALVGVLAPLPGLSLTWLDTAPERFPAAPEGVKTLARADLVGAAKAAPGAAWHLVLTHSHALDFALCAALLGQGFGGLGLIGSRTKWARFRKRLIAAGHAPAAVDRIQCPVGETRAGKHPQAIAISIAHALLMDLGGQRAGRGLAGSEGEGDDGRALEA
ncbi:MAG: xanthine dehydrogenase accessory protein XdhC [Alphaproteobacteria bacterium]|nr:MAG: xanthine dehydrogenase accessory protein XdhC [Alphaproteobacteria bacterium]